MIIEVDVTQDDIDGGTPSDPCHCPVALGLRRATSRDVMVSDTDFGFVGRFGEVTGSQQLPGRAQRWIKGFDNPLVRPEMEPFTFIVELDG